jgi:hypothetical protein
MNRNIISLIRDLRISERVGALAIPLDNPMDTIPYVALEVAATKI